MEKEQKLKKKIMKILPKGAGAVTVVTFQNPAFSPGRDHQFVHKYKQHGRKVSTIPDEARRKAKDGGRGNHIIESQEPTSPKVSCMGQIKHKKQHQHQHIKKVKAKSMLLPKQRPPPTEVKKHTSTFRRIFRGGRKLSNASAADDGPAVAPALSQMKRFSSGRDAFASFDWKAQVMAPQPRTEINLWKRRTMAPPTPLQLNPRHTPI